MMVLIDGLMKVLIDGLMMVLIDGLIRSSSVDSSSEAEGMAEEGV